MRELPFRGVIDLRLDQRDKGARDAAELALVVALPEAGLSVIGPAGNVLWLGPDEFLIVTEPEREIAVAASLLGALRGRRAAVIDISDSRTIIALSGIHARDVLAKGCGIDLTREASRQGNARKAPLPRRASRSISSTTHRPITSSSSAALPSICGCGSPTPPQNFAAQASRRPRQTPANIGHDL
jgi:heterotetrameric sarcosine oxidase gamma subunit